MPAPVGKSGVVGKGLMGMSVKADTKFPNASMALAQFFTNARTLTELAKQSAVYPSSPKAFEDPYFSAESPLIEDSARGSAGETIAKYADIVPTIPNKGDVNAIVLAGGREGPVRRSARPAGADRRRRRGQQAARLRAAPPSRPASVPPGGGPTPCPASFEATRSRPAGPDRPMTSEATARRRTCSCSRRWSCSASSSSTRSWPSSGTASPTTTSSGRRSSSASTTSCALLDDDTFKLALLHSFIYLLVTPILIVLSIGLAIVVNRKLRGIHIYRALYFVPAVSGSASPSGCRGAGCSTGAGSSTRCSSRGASSTSRSSGSRRRPSSCRSR